MESTWESRDLPVLDAIVSALDEDMMAIINVGDVADRLDIDAVDAFKACQALRGTYIQLDLVMAGGSPRPTPPHFGRDRCRSSGRGSVAVCGRLD